MNEGKTYSSGKIAILGANGFVGGRLVEIFHLRDQIELIPIVRRVAAMSRLSRFDLEARVADVRLPDELEKGLQGCHALVDCTVGMPADIEAAARALIPAAKKAGVRRIVYLSSASVHGQNPVQGSDENTPLSDRQEMAYNNAKVRAERHLFADARHLGIELFVLRPSIVFGPRDRWISSLVGDLEQGTAWLIENGQGLCNTIYVDNLVEAVRCCLVAPSQAAGRAYLVGDAEWVTWHGLYERTARAMGMEYENVRQIPVPPVPVRTLSHRLNALRALPLTQRLIAGIPARLKSIIKGALTGSRLKPTPSPWQLDSVQSTICPSREMVLLQQYQHRFPQALAVDELGYKPIVSFDEGLRRTVEWIRWTRS